MDKERFLEIESSDLYVGLFLELWPLHCMIIHGCIKLTLQHPEVKETFGEPFKREAKGIMDVLEAYLKDVGFTDEEIFAQDSGQL